MRLLADENVPLASVRILREAGHDVESVLEVARGASDRHVLDRAARDLRLVITFDQDFGHLVFGEHVPAAAGVVYLRFVPKTPEEAGVLLASLFVRDGLSFRGRFSVVDRERVRQRRIGEGR